MEEQLIEQLKISCMWLQYVDGHNAEARGQIAVWQKLIEQAEEQLFKRGKDVETRLVGR